jgi:polyhydroxyalkanoate synthase
LKPAWPLPKAVEEKARALRAELASADPELFRVALGRELRRRLDSFERGLHAYRHHPYRRAPSSHPVVWRDGTTRLIDFAPRGGVPVLVVPSLINRADVLDLMPERSLLAALAASGLRPFLVDWDAPGPTERRFDLTDYIGGRLAGALDHVLDQCGTAPVVLGYCMGGLLALALARLRRHDVRALALLATPWDFHAERAELGQAFARALLPWLPWFDTLGEMPVDVLQALFTGLDPFLAARKFIAFADLDPASAKAREFVALEDWLNDGVALAAPVARECLIGWYGANATARRRWHVAGKVIDPADIAMPTLVVVPEHDRIVPPRSARALAEAIPGAVVLTPPLGHIGMVVGARAPAALWQPLAAWLASPAGARL